MPFARKHGRLDSRNGKEKKCLSLDLNFSLLSLDVKVLFFFFCLFVFFFFLLSCMLQSFQQLAGTLFFGKSLIFMLFKNDLPPRCLTFKILSFFFPGTICSFVFFSLFLSLDGKLFGNWFWMMWQNLLPQTSIANICSFYFCDVWRTEGQQGLRAHFFSLFQQAGSVRRGRKVPRSTQNKTKQKKK